ncbi:hypothetical protein HYPSUDRAFT_602700 [Hypholoma sublateritium FD-334 SS-4]|uniref:DEAD/DEAH-box helicase domain-containing protein n=1 Tax=Hypholoma sublateritium (strain FD-334 SS-4) TaxID=945553 RepID=A0A0D2PTZ4_HYPSF|nr:hypothetical protein HYPSUDRAFT_602700 [Hypholoma sublateritium FD-334 SS-4]
MLEPPPVFDWEVQRKYNWTKPDGLDLIKTKLSSYAAFTPHDFQLNCTALILNGTDVVCITATGDGKSALIYMPVMVQHGAISLVVSPTNFLESDMEASFRNKGLSALAINGETLAAAEHCRPSFVFFHGRLSTFKVVFFDFALCL